MTQEKWKRYYVDSIIGTLWYTYVGGNRWMRAKNPKSWISAKKMDKWMRMGWVRLTYITPSPEQLKALLVLSN